MLSVGGSFSYLVWYEHVYTFTIYKKIVWEKIKKILVYPWKVIHILYIHLLKSNNTVTFFLIYSWTATNSMSGFHI